MKATSKNTWHALNVAGKRAAVIAVCGAIVFFAAPIRAGSIFDDDYTPPKRSEPSAPQPTPAPIPSPSTPKEKPATPNPRPPDVAAPTPAEPATLHRAIPDRASRAKCRKLFEEVYGKELKDHAPDARRKLAQTLLDEAAKTDAGSADRFVLLTGAMQAAEEAQNLQMSFDAARQLAEAYDVDELAAEADAATKTFAGRASPTLGESENIDSLRELVDRVIADDDFNLAAPLTPVLQRAGASAADPALKSEVKDQSRELALYRETREKIAPAIEKLKTSPTDPAANLAVGSFLCFQRGSWSLGLPMLAQGSDAALKDLATAELAVPAGSDAKIALADKWFAAASKLPATDRGKALEHSAELYRDGETGLTGLQRLAVEKRLAGFPKSSLPKGVNLVKMFAPASVMAGEWRLENGKLIAKPSGYARVDFAYQPPEEYDFRISFTVTDPKGAVGQICYCNGHQFMYQLGGWDNHVVGFEVVGGAGGDRNNTTKKKDHWLTTGEHYVSVIKVRKDGAEAYLDGQLITSLKTNYSDLSMFGGWGLQHANSVGIGESEDGVRFDVVEIIAVTGHGKILSK